MKIPLRVLTIFMMVLFLSSSVLTPLAEANMWEERLASLPAQLKPHQQASQRVMKQMPTIKPALPTASTEKEDFKKWDGIGDDLKKVMTAIPVSHATIQRVHDAKEKKPPIVLIQDVHLNSEAQENIAKVIKSLMKEGIVGSVGVEGAFNEFDFKPFRSIVDQEKLSSVAEDLLQNNKISAPTFVGMTSSMDPPPFIGIDDPLHYEANVKAYLDSREQREVVNQKITSLRKELNDEKEKHYSKELKKLDRAVGAYHAGNLSFADYVSVLSSYSDQIDFNVEKFIEAYKLETSLDFRRVEQERRQLITKLTQALSKDEIENLLSTSVAYRMGKVQFGDFYRHIRALCQQKGISLQTAPAFENYIRYVLLSDGIEAAALFESVQKLEKETLFELAATTDIQYLVQRNRQLVFMEKLLSFSLTPTEWKDYKSGPRDIKVDTFERFYEEADVRSHKMVDKALSIETSDPLLLVMGGFHSADLMALLQQKKRSFVVVSPKITKVDLENATSYLSVFAQEKAPLNTIFKGKKLFISPTSVAAVGSTSGYQPNPLTPLINGFIETARQTVADMEKLFPGLKPAQPRFSTTLFDLASVILWGGFVVLIGGVVFISIFVVRLILRQTSSPKESGGIKITGRRKDQDPHRKEIKNNEGVVVILHTIEISGGDSATRPTVDDLFGELFARVMSMNPPENSLVLDIKIDLDQQNIRLDWVNRNSSLPIKLYPELAKIFQEHFPGYSTTGYARGIGAAFGRFRYFDGEIDPNLLSANEQKQRDLLALMTYVAEQMKEKGYWTTSQTLTLGDVLRQVHDRNDPNAEGFRFEIPDGDSVYFESLPMRGRVRPKGTPIEPRDLPEEGLFNGQPVTVVQKTDHLDIYDVEVGDKKVRILAEIHGEIADRDTQKTFDQVKRDPVSWALVLEGEIGEREDQIQTIESAGALVYRIPGASGPTQELLQKGVVTEDQVILMWWFFFLSQLGREKREGPSEKEFKEFLGFYSGVVANLVGRYGINTTPEKAMAVLVQSLKSGSSMDTLFKEVRQIFDLFVDEADKGQRDVVKEVLKGERKSILIHIGQSHLRAFLTETRFLRKTIEYLREDMDIENISNALRIDGKENLTWGLWVRWFGIPPAIAARWVAPIMEFLIPAAVFAGSFYAFGFIIAVLLSLSAFSLPHLTGVLVQGYDGTYRVQQEYGRWYEKFMAVLPFYGYAVILFGPLFLSFYLSFVVSIFPLQLGTILIVASSVFNVVLHHLLQPFFVREESVLDHLMNDYIEERKFRIRESKIALINLIEGRAPPTLIEKGQSNLQSREQDLIELYKIRSQFRKAARSEEGLREFFKQYAVPVDSEMEGLKKEIRELMIVEFVTFPGDDVIIIDRDSPLSDLLGLRNKQMGFFAKISFLEKEGKRAVPIVFISDRKNIGTATTIIHELIHYRYVKEEKGGYLARIVDEAVTEIRTSKKIARLVRYGNSELARRWREDIMRENELSLDELEDFVEKDYQKKSAYNRYISFVQRQVAEEIGWEELNIVYNWQDYTRLEKLFPHRKHIDDVGPIFDEHARDGSNPFRFSLMRWLILNGQDFSEERWAALKKIAQEMRPYAGSIDPFSIVDDLVEANSEFSSHQESAFNRLTSELLVDRAFIQWADRIEKEGMSTAEIRKMLFDDMQARALAIFRELVPQHNPIVKDLAKAPSGVSKWWQESLLVGAFFSVSLVMFSFFLPIESWLGLVGLAGLLSNLFFVLLHWKGVYGLVRGQGPPELVYQGFGPSIFSRDRGVAFIKLFGLGLVFHVWMFASVLAFPSLSLSLALFLTGLSFGLALFLHRTYNNLLLNPPSSFTSLFFRRIVLALNLPLASGLRNQSPASQQQQIIDLINSDPQIRVSDIEPSQAFRQRLTGETSDLTAGTVDQVLQSADPAQAPVLAYHFLDQSSEEAAWTALNRLVGSWKNNANVRMEVVVRDAALAEVLQKRAEADGMSSVHLVSYADGMDFMNLLDQSVTDNANLDWNWVEKADIRLFVSDGYNLPSSFLDRARDQLSLQQLRVYLLILDTLTPVAVEADASRLDLIRLAQKIKIFA